MPFIDYKTLATSALAFTIAIAVNEGVSSSVRALYPQDRRGSAHATAVYALIVTLLVIIIVVAINHVERATTGLVSHFKTKIPASPRGGGPIIQW